MDPQLYRRFFEIEDWFWWCVGTRRVFFELIERTGLRGRAIDVGCGTGAAVRHFPPGWTLVAGCDYSPLALSFCRERGLRDLIRCTGTALPFSPDSFDVVMAIDVIEHLDDDEACMREMVRICRPGGYVLAHVPAFEILWTDKDDVNYHRRRYRRRQLVALMERYGLTVETAFYLNSLLFPAAALRALNQKVRWTLSPRPPVSAATIDHLYNLPGFVNRVMTGLMEFEHRVVKPLSLPFGMSVVCLARKMNGEAPRLRGSLQASAGPESPVLLRRTEPARQEQAAFRALAGKVIHRIVENPAVFFYARTHFYWGTMRHLRRALDLQPGERLLDVGCGSGMGAGLTRGTYVGIDTELKYLRFARARLRRWLTHSFIDMSVLQLGFRDNAFDKAMILNVLHHLDEAFIDQFLAQLKRVVRKKVFVLDHDIERDNLVSGWLVRQDRGEYMRPCGELQRILEHHYDVERCERFFNIEHTIAHVLFTLVPR